jgi:hypothetical protein
MPALPLTLSEQQEALDQSPFNPYTTAPSGRPMLVMMPGWHGRTLTRGKDTHAEHLPLPLRLDPRFRQASRWEMSHGEWEDAPFPITGGFSPQSFRR